MNSNGVHNIRVVGHSIHRTYDSSQVGREEWGRTQAIGSAGIDAGRVHINRTTGSSQRRRPIGPHTREVQPLWSVTVTCTLLGRIKYGYGPPLLSTCKVTGITTHYRSLATKGSQWSSSGATTLHHILANWNKAISSTRPWESCLINRHGKSAHSTIFGS